jgi:DNA-binding NarL/FixJ family response regulator
MDAQDDLEVVAEAPDGEQALAVLRRLAIDVAVLDVRMPRLGGLQVVETIASDARTRLTQRDAPTRVVLVTATDLDRYAPSGAAAGAAAVLVKDADPEVLLAAIRDAAGGRTAPGLR